jgi:SAM-dependent methyltransferase
MNHNLKAAAMWGGGGRAYDEISRSVASAIEHCVTRLQPKPGEQIADIATGTGWTSRLVARSGAQVTGVDIAEGMLAGAREIAQEQGLAIDYRLGDAEALPFDDGTFDAVISTFGVMFAPDQSRAAAELARVCKRGGRLAIAAWTPDSEAVKFRQVLQPFMAAPPPPSPPSPFVWGTRDWLAGALSISIEDAGDISIGDLQTLFLLDSGPLPMPSSFLFCGHRKRDAPTSSVNSLGTRHRGYPASSVTRPASSSA